jgi:hypothetical protein
VGRDVTERKRALARLQASEQRWATMVGLASDWYWETDAQHRVLPMTPELHRRFGALERGAWAVPSRVEVMELNIPAIHGVGKSRIYFVDRYDKFSIYDVDFVPIPTVDQHPLAVAGLHFFGVVTQIKTLHFFDDND